MSEAIQFKPDQLSLLKENRVSEFLSSMNYGCYPSNVSFELPIRLYDTSPMLEGDYLMADKNIIHTITTMQGMTSNFEIQGRKYSVTLVKNKL